MPFHRTITLITLFRCPRGPVNNSFRFVETSYTVNINNLRRNKTHNTDNRDGDTVMRALRAKCPHCETLAAVRTSRSITRISTEFRFQCPNVECGHTFVGLLEVTHTISPPASPHPEVNLRNAQQTAQIRTSSAS